jgi:hypothetical protein
MLLGIALYASSAKAMPIDPGDTTVIAQGQEYDSGDFLKGKNKTFVDNFYFSVPATLIGLGTLTVAKPGQILKIKDLTLTWLEGATTLSSLVITDGTGHLGPITSLTFSLLDPVLYTLRVSGQLLTDTATYDLQINTTPLPPAWLLFVSALGGLTVLGRRSRRSSKLSA